MMINVDMSSHGEQEEKEAVIQEIANHLRKLGIPVSIFGMKEDVRNPAHDIILMNVRKSAEQDPDSIFVNICVEK